MVVNCFKSLNLRQKLAEKSAPATCQDIGKCVSVFTCHILATGLKFRVKAKFLHLWSALFAFVTNIHSCYHCYLKSFACFNTLKPSMGKRYDVWCILVQYLFF